MERQLNDAVVQLHESAWPLNCFIVNHTGRGGTPAPFHEACFTHTSFNLGCRRTAIKSRFSLPFAVSNPFSMENGSRDMERPYLLVVRQLRIHRVRRLRLLPVTLPVTIIER